MNSKNNSARRPRLFGRIDMACSLGPGNTYGLVSWSWCTAFINWYIIYYHFKERDFESEEKDESEEQKAPKSKGKKKEETEPEKIPDSTLHPEIQVRYPLIARVEPLTYCVYKGLCKIIFSTQSVHISWMPNISETSADSLMLPCLPWTMTRTSSPWVRNSNFISKNNPDQGPGKLSKATILRGFAALKACHFALFNTSHLNFL